MTSKLFDLAGKTALVTGSSRGLGHAIARGLAEAGAQVVVHGRDRDAAEAAADALRGEGHAATSTAFDVSDAAAVTASASELAENGVKPAIVVNNAGINLRSPLLEQSFEDWRKVIGTHLDGAFHVAQAFVPAMLAAGEGKLINICSLTSHVSRPSISAYATAKGGLAMLTRSMAVEWAKEGICCNGIAPGFFATDMNRSLVDDDEFDRWVCSRTPAGRWGRTDELVGAAVFLASPASAYVNGHILAVDGGFLASM